MEKFSLSFMFQVHGSLNPTRIGWGGEGCFRSPSQGLHMILLHNQWGRRYCCSCVPRLLRKLNKNFSCIMYPKYHHFQYMIYIENKKQKTKNFSCSESSSPIWLPCYRRKRKRQASVRLPEASWSPSQAGGQDAAPNPAPCAPLQAALQPSPPFGIGLRMFRAMWEDASSQARL